MQPYVGVWNARCAAHLLRRVGFGGSSERIETLARSTRTDAIATMRESLHEAMTLFWHEHFGTFTESEMHNSTFLVHNRLFRKNALGSVRDLTMQVSMNPAMIRSFDGGTRGTLPHEPFARMLLDRFTLGPGLATDGDVRATARALAGWQVGSRTSPDVATKVFLGRCGPFDGADIISLAFAHPACARFFAEKLWTFFVYDDPEAESIDALAAEIVAHDFVVEPILGRLFASKAFYSERAFYAE
jgi:uncharacterized protein (DUF1800 family)